MMLGIYGAGGLGREVLILAQIINVRQPRWADIFFIDDIHPNRVLKGIKVKNFDSVSHSSDTEIVIAVGEPATRAVLAEKIRSRQGRLATLIHPSVNIPDCASIGDGAVLCMGSVVSCDVTIGENVYLQPYACVGHDCQIGANSVVSTCVSLGGGCQVGARTFIGMGAPVQQNTTIGDDVIIGMGSVVFSDIQDEMLALGNPARMIRKNDQKKVFK